MCKFEFALQEVRTSASQSNEQLVKRGWSDGLTSAKLTWPARTHAGAWDDL